MTTVEIAGTRHRLLARRLIGTGGEADVFGLPGNVACKVWKGPDHPDLAGLPDEQAAARVRRTLYAAKVQSFPAAMPPRLAAPVAVARDTSSGEIVGFTMPWIDGADLLRRLGEPASRGAGVTAQQVVALLLDLRATVSAVHRRNVVVGDFNDCNVLVIPERGQAWLIDADSMQLPGYPCLAYTLQYLDPRLLKLTNGQPTLAAAFDVDSDWFAFAGLVVRCLLMVGPWGGIHRARGGAVTPLLERVAGRISIFDPQTRYPRPALAPDNLPEALIDILHQTLSGQRRGPFPADMLTQLRWHHCPTCGIEHARRSSHCASCRIAVTVPTVVHGGLEIRTLLDEPEQTICEVVVGPRELRWLTYDGMRFRREEQGAPRAGRLAYGARFALFQGRTLHVTGGRISDGNATLAAVDVNQAGPVFAANSAGWIWSEAGILYGATTRTTTRLGTVIAGTARVWLGEHLAFGLSPAGRMPLAFCWRVGEGALNDSIALPALPGGVRDAACVLGRDRIWLAIGSDVWLLDDRGGLLAHADDPEWLLGLAGATTLGHALLVPTDEGVIRVEQRDGTLLMTGRFPDTAVAVHQGTRLLTSPDGLIARDNHRIRILRMS